MRRPRWRLGGAKNSGALFFESIARMGSGFVVAVLLARQYGPDGLGLITTATASVTIFMGFSALGLSGVLVRELAEKIDKRGTVLLTITLAKLVAGTILLAVMLASLALFAKDPQLVTLSLIMGSGFLFSSLDTVDSLYNARIEFTRLVALRLGALAASTVVKVLAITLGWGLEFVAVGYALDYALLYLVPTFDFVTRRRGGLRDGATPLKWDAGELKALLSRSWPVLVSGGFAQINLRIDALIILALSSVTSVGIYSAASRLSEAWSVLAMAIVTAAFPGLVRLARADVPKYALALSALLRRLIWISFIGAVLIAFLAPVIIQILYGSEFGASAAVLSIHVAGGVFLFVRTAVSRWLIIENLLKFSLVSHVSGAAINIGLNFLLIPVYGPQGAAWASVASYATSGILFLLFTKRTRLMFFMIMWSALPARFAESRTIRLAGAMATNRKEEP